MILPVRLQLSRRKGFNLQALSLEVNGLPAVNCARPGAWGNRWRIGETVQRFSSVTICYTFMIKDGADAVACHREEFAQHRANPKAEPLVRQAMDDALRGRNLACWCDLCSPCHCDNLIVLANAPRPVMEPGG